MKAERCCCTVGRRKFRNAEDEDGMSDEDYYDYEDEPDDNDDDDDNNDNADDDDNDDNEDGVLMNDLTEIDDELDVDREPPSSVDADDKLTQKDLQVCRHIYSLHTCSVIIHVCTRDFS